MSTSKMLIAILGLVFLAAPVCSGDKDVKNLEQLKQDLKSPDPAVRVQAIRDILQFKYQGVEEVIPLLVQRLRDPNDKIRTGASIALRRMQIPRNRVAEVVRASETASPRTVKLSFATRPSSRCNTWARMHARLSGILSRESKISKPMKSAASPSTLWSRRA